MDWTGIFERNGLQSPSAGSEPFHPLAQLAASHKQAGYPTARVASTVGTSAEYGGVKVSFTVSVDCPQDEAHIKLAGEAVFLKAVELVNDGASFLGAPPLRSPG